jgi:putative heme-binding domain-containing protein
MPIANRYYEAVRGWSPQVLEMISPDHYFSAVTEKVRQVDHHGGFTAAAGHALYTARNYPPAYWNRTAFVCEPTAHLVATFVIEPHGAGFRSRNAWNLVASDDEWAAPIMAEVGPDGNVWVLDWYNYIVQHNPTPVGFTTGKGNAYETELRDKRHARIFRVVPKGWKEGRSPSLKQASSYDLVAALGDSNQFWRLHAQRLLIERNFQDATAVLIGLVGNRSGDDAGLNVVAIHALRTLQGWNAIVGGTKAAIAVDAALKHPSAAVRRTAVEVLPRDSASQHALINTGLLQDRDPQVRSAALLSTAEMPPSIEAAGAILTSLRDEATATDPTLRDAAVIAAAHHTDAFLTVVLSEKEPVGPPVQEVVARVAEHYARGEPRNGVAGMLSLAKYSQSPARPALLAGLARGWPRNAPVVLPPFAEDAIEKMLGSLPDAEQADLVQLAEKLGSKTGAQYAEQIAVTLIAKAKDAKLDDSARIAAARKAVAFRKTDSSLPGQLLALVTARSSPEFAQGMLAAVGQSEVPAVGKQLLDRLDSLTPAARPAAISMLLARSEWTAALVDALAARRVPIGELSLDQKQALAAHPDGRLAKRAREMLASAGGLPNSDRQKVLTELLPLCATKGDAAAGKFVFTKQCAKCHMHSGEGQKIGPDLTGMAAHPKQELLVHLIDPSRSVEGNFRVYTVVTADGLVMNGLLAAETKTAIELIDAEGKRHALQRDEIEELTASTKSIMPEGFEKQVTRDELTNLLEFLTTRGKYFPLDLRKVASAVSTKGLFTHADAAGERLVFDDWLPKTFAGVPFTLVDPQGDRVPNVVLLHGPNGYLAPRMPKSVRLPCNAAVKALHVLGGVGGWIFPASKKGTTSLVVRLHYADGQTEDHRLVNGEHVADYLRRTDVPGSQFAFDLHGRQVRYLAVTPRRPDVIREIEFAKGDDDSAPIIMAATVETGEQP